MTCVFELEFYELCLMDEKIFNDFLTGIESRLCM